MWYRLRDLICASMGLLLLSPLLLLIMLALWVSQGQVFFTQWRTGREEKSFLLIKFSTLRPLGPGEKVGEDEHLRLTSVGKYVRRFSLDELPQLWNVIRGDMTLVGPRPLLPEYLPLYQPEDRIRHQVKPGITGWAQIHGRNLLSFRERFVLDRWYVENRNFWLDLRIIWKTFFRLAPSQEAELEQQLFSPKFNGKN
ncbi:MAG: sugar transferase [Bacteroidota bacterium]